MEKKNYAILDVAKFISALFVIAVHCAPFIQVSESLNFVYVQIFARLAVPFFFLVSGFLFFRKIDPEKGRKDEGNIKEYKHYIKRILRIYIVWSILYVPLLMINWMQGGFTISTILRFVRDILWNGTYYHLWFLPALMVGVSIVYIAYTSLQKRFMLWICLGLYLLGMLGNVYGVILHDVAGIGSILSAYEAVFITTRNGVFFAPIFLALGIYVNDFIKPSFKKPAFYAFLLSFGLYIGEAFWLKSIWVMHDLTSMYAMLVPCIFFLFITVIQWNLKPSLVYHKLRKMSLLIYVGHIYFVFLFLNILKLSNIVVYGLSIICSCIVSYVIVSASKKWKWLKALY